MLAFRGRLLALRRLLHLTVWWVSFVQHLALSWVSIVLLSRTNPISLSQKSIKELVFSFSIGAPVFYQAVLSIFWSESTLNQTPLNPLPFAKLLVYPRARFCCLVLILIEPCRTLRSTRRSLCVFRVCRFSVARYKATVRIFHMRASFLHRATIKLKSAFTTL